MLNAIAHGRIGRDAELRFAPSGDFVADLAIACNYGRKDAEGKQPTQWVRASLWGKQAEALAQYLTKGKGVVAVLQDLHIEEFDGKNGKASSLVGRVISIEFSISQPRDDDAQEPRAPRQATPAPRTHGDRLGGANQRPAAASAGTGFDDMDGEIPF